MQGRSWQLGCRSGKGSSLDVNHQLGLGHEQCCAHGVVRCMLRQKRVLQRRCRADKDESQKGTRHDFYSVESVWLADSTIGCEPEYVRTVN